MWTVLKVSLFQIRLNLMGLRSWYMFLAECFLGSGLSTNAVFFQDKTFTVCLVKDVSGPRTIPGPPGEHSHFDLLGSGSVNPIHCRATVWTETLEKSYPVPYLNDRYGMHSTFDAFFMYLLSIFCTNKRILGWAGLSADDSKCSQGPGSEGALNFCSAERGQSMFEYKDYSGHFCLGSALSDRFFCNLLQIWLIAILLWWSLPRGA